MNAGCADNAPPAVERREAQHPSQGCARLRTARGRPDRKGCPQKGASQAPWRLPALHPPFWGKEKGRQAHPGPSTTGAAERWLFDNSD